MTEILAMASAIAAVTVGVVEAVKRTEVIHKNYLPLAAILIGVGLGGLAVFLNVDLVSRLWAGGISGLASVGLFEFSKHTIKGDE